MYCFDPPPPPVNIKPQPSSRTECRELSAYYSYYYQIIIIIIFNNIKEMFQAHADLLTCGNSQ